MFDEKYRFVLAYNTEKNNFYTIDSESSAPESSPVLIIDEKERKSQLLFPKTTSLIQKRIIERYALSYLKTGYSIDDQGLRVGANFPLEIIGDEVLPEVLLTQGYSFGKSKLKLQNDLFVKQTSQPSVAIHGDIPQTHKESVNTQSTEKKAFPSSSTTLQSSSSTPSSEAKDVPNGSSSELSSKISNPVELTNFAKYFDLGLNYEQYYEKIENPDHKSKYKSYYERFNITSDHTNYLENDIENQINILIIGAEWCSDCQVNIPIIQHIVQNSKKILLRILIKENYSDILLPTNGGQHIPYVMFLSSDGYVVERWTERSTEQYQLYASLRKQLGWDNPEFTKESKKLFTHDYEKYSQATANEIIQKIKRVDAILSTSARLHKST